MMPFTGWENFYVIVGSSAGALIGLQFVVVTLIAEIPVQGDVERAGSAFATPTVVHFGAVLLLAAVVSAPWRQPAGAEVVWGLMGLGGILYEFIVIRRMRVQNVYSPLFEDWLFYALLPLAAYAILAASACFAPSHLVGALFAAAAAALLLLFIGIHNAWDAVTYHVFIKQRRQ
jgi:hypothetical protein